MKISKKTFLLASTFLVNDADITIDEMVKKIAEHKNQHDFIDNVDEVVVWQIVENTLTCKDFLETIGYGEKEQEMRVYVVNTHDERVEDIEDFHDLTDEEFMFEAEEQGRVYTIEGFQRAFNDNEVNTEIDFIRFIEVKI
jgi:hypothetical protein